jgi:hypothetical protein
MSKFRSLTALVLLCLFVMPAFGWNETGHKLVAYIAWQKMTPAAREKVNTLFQAAPEDSDIAGYFAFDSRSVAARQLEQFMIVATWADIIRDRKFPVRQAKYHHGTWHYSDIFFREVNGKIELVTDLKDDPQNAVERLNFMQGVLSDAAKTDAERVIALAWILHLVGDVHQPLHSVARVTDLEPKGDQGGNLFELTPKDTPKEKKENLHSYWDSIVTLSAPRVNDACDGDYLPELGQKFMKKYPEGKMQAQVDDLKFEDWRQEGLDNAVKYVYAGLNRYEKPSSKYQKQAYQLSQKEIALGGYRLAKLLNKILGQ